ncbi:MAG: radical SAM protein [Deltaproteobacteria bacterium]|nr:radical SAM protein [Deltaproteobacteria bacterium]
MRKKNLRSVFHIYLIKPTHYDDDGYPIIWRKTFIPSNSLAVLNGLCMDFAHRQVIGPNVDVYISVVDEQHTRVVPERIARHIHQRGERGFVGMVGVQTNQFPRALDLAYRFTDCQIPVCMGGFHVAGFLATMKRLPVEALEAQRRGISFFVGESETGRLDEVLMDAWQQKLKPLYNYLGDMPDLGGQPLPQLPMSEVRKSFGEYAPFDLGRGCPFSCTFCTIINVHGQKSRCRRVDELEQIIRVNYANGVRQFFLTDDNIARNKLWEPFFERLIQLRREGLRFRILAQVDTACHTIPRFIPRAVAAGIDQIIVGIESMNAENLRHIQKRQNRIEHYRENLLAWKRFPVVITATYIIGLPYDTIERVREDVATIQRELPIDAIYFTNLTPLPGSEVHRDLLDTGQWLDNDYNKYDTNHYVTTHPRMTQAEWREANAVAWRTFYTPEHMQTVIRRMVACGSNKKLTTIYRLAVCCEFGRGAAIHPLDAGLFRKRYRRDRRPGYAREGVISFHLAHIADVLKTSWRFHRTIRRLYKLWKRLQHHPDALRYADRAIAEVASTAKTHRLMGGAKEPGQSVVTSSAKSLMQKS